MTDPDRLVPVAIVYNPAQLAVLISLLEDRGLPAFVLSWHLVTMQWSLAVAFGGMRLCVRAADAPAATALLAGLEPWTPGQLFTGSRWFDFVFSLLVLLALALPPPPRASATFLIDRHAIARRQP